MRECIKIVLSLCILLCIPFVLFGAQRVVVCEMIGDEE